MSVSVGDSNGSPSGCGQVRADSLGDVLRFGLVQTHRVDRERLGESVGVDEHEGCTAMEAAHDGGGVDDDGPGIDRDDDIRGDGRLVGRGDRRLDAVQRIERVGDADRAVVSPGRERVVILRDDLVQRRQQADYLLIPIFSGRPRPWRGTPPSRSGLRSSSGGSRTASAAWVSRCWAATDSTRSHRPARMPVVCGPRIAFPLLNATRSAPSSANRLRFALDGSSAAASTTTGTPDRARSSPPPGAAARCTTSRRTRPRRCPP